MLGRGNLLLVFVLWGALALAAEVRLYQNGNQVEDYNGLIRELKLGDVIVFDDGSRFRFVDRIGEGDTTRILQVAPEARRPGEPERMALRVPYASGDYYTSNGQRPYTDFINLTIEGYPLFDRVGGIVPRRYRSATSQYIAVEMVPHDYTLHNFLRDSKIPEEERKVAEAALLDFAKATVGLDSIGDFHPRQLVYSRENNRWTLLDWTSASKKFWFPQLQRDHIFGDVFANRIAGTNDMPWNEVRYELPARTESLLNRLDKAINEERRRIMPVRFCLDRVIRHFIPSLQELH